VTKEIEMAKACGIAYYLTPENTTEMHGTDRQIQTLVEAATKAAYLKIAADYRRVEGERFYGADVAIWCECEADAL